MEFFEKLIVNTTDKYKIKLKTMWMTILYDVFPFAGFI